MPSLPLDDIVLYDESEREDFLFTIVGVRKARKGEMVADLDEHSVSYMGSESTKARVVVEKAVAQ